MVQKLPGVEKKVKINFRKKKEKKMEQENGW